MEWRSAAAATLALLSLVALAGLPFLLEADPPATSDSQDDATQARGSPGDPAPGSGPSADGEGPGEGHGDGGPTTDSNGGDGFSFWFLEWLAGLFGGGAPSSDDVGGGGPGDQASSEAETTTAPPKPPRPELDLRTLLLFIAVPLALLLLAGFIVHRYRRRNQGEFSDDDTPPDDPTQGNALAHENAWEQREHVILQAYATARHHLRTQGHPATPDTTPTEYARAVPMENAPPLQDLTTLYLAVRYGEREPTPERIQRAQQLAQAITQEGDPAG